MTRESNRQALQTWRAGDKQTLIKPLQEQMIWVPETDIWTGSRSPPVHYVQGVADDFAKQETAQALIRAAKAAGSRLLAEGIEREEDWRWLLDAGYELFQGYFFGKPEPEPREVAMALHR